MKQRVLLKGADALDLIHRISTVNLKALPPHQKSPGLFLSPSGKILSFFELSLESKDSVLVEFEENFLEILEQYTFSEQFEIEHLPNNEESSSSERARILSLTPKPGNEFQLNGETNPLEVNLRSAISDQKGCYPGQEVIEKIISIGSPAKKLCLLETTSTKKFDLPMKLFDESNQEVGLLTSLSEGFGLGIIKRTKLKEGTILFHETDQFIVRKVSSS
jgi:folate-binding protein YgfZ